jgi:hypothetical protein
LGGSSILGVVESVEVVGSSSFAWQECSAISMWLGPGLLGSSSTILFVLSVSGKAVNYC